MLQLKDEPRWLGLQVIDSRLWGKIDSTRNGDFNIPPSFFLSFPSGLTFGWIQGTCWQQTFFPSLNFRYLFPKKFLNTFLSFPFCWCFTRIVFLLVCKSVRPSTYRWLLSSGSNESPLSSFFSLRDKSSPTTTMTISQTGTLSEVHLIIGNCGGLNKRC